MLGKIAFTGAFFLAPWAAAKTASHVVTARLTLGGTTYTQTVKVQEGAQANVAGPVDASGRRMALDVLLSPEDADLLLEYRLEFGSGIREIEAQGTVGLGPGAAVETVECGAWAIEFAVDAASSAARGSKTAWDGGGAANYRLTADISTPAGPRRCRQALRMDTQSSIADGGTKGAKKYGFAMNTVITAAPAGRDDELQYQLEDTPVGGSPFQLESQETLKPGRRSVARSAGHEIEWLLEAPPPAAARPAQLKPPALP